MDKNGYLNCLKIIAERYLPLEHRNMPEKIFTHNSKYGVINDLSAMGKNYTHLDSDDNLHKLAEDAYEWNKFLLKRRHGIDVDKDIAEGKYCAEKAFILTTIYGHEGAIKYLSGQQRLPKKLEELLPFPTEPMKVITEIKPIKSKNIHQTPVGLEIIIPELVPIEVRLTVKQQKMADEDNKAQAYKVFKKIEAGEVTNLFKKNMLIKAHSLYDEKHSKIHACFDDAEFFTKKFGFISSFADPIEDSKHSTNEIFNKSFSLAHWGFKNQNSHLQTSGFGSGVVDNSHSHKDFHLDQAFINRVQITTTLEHGKLNIEQGNFNYHTLFKGNRSLMTNYSVENSNHAFGVHYYNPYKSKNAGFISGLNFDLKNSGERDVMAYSGYSKDFKNLSLEVSPVYVRESALNAELQREVYENVGLRFSQSVPLKLFSNKQNVGVMNSTMLFNDRMLNSTSFMVNNNLFNLNATYSVEMRKDKASESTIDAHAVYNPLKKVAVYGAFEQKLSGSENETEYKFGAYLSPIKSFMTNVEFKQDNSEKAFGIGIHKIFGGRNVASVEADISPHNFVPTNIKAKLNIAIK